MTAFIWLTICPQFRDLIPCPVLSVTLHSHFPWPIAQTVKNLPGMRETYVQSLGWEDALEEGMATHSGILAWRISWTQAPGGLQSRGLQRIRHDWATNTHRHLLAGSQCLVPCLQLCDIILPFILKSLFVNLSPWKFKYLPTSLIYF